MFIDLATHPQYFSCGPCLVLSFTERLLFNFTARSRYVRVAVLLVLLRESRLSVRPSVWNVGGLWFRFMFILYFNCSRIVYSVSQKNPPWGDVTFFHFFHKRLRIFNRFFTHLLYVPIYARLQIFIQLSLILTKLCHIKRDYPVHIICSKCPPSAETHAFKRLRKSLIALLIVVCGKSL